MKGSCRPSASTALHAACPLIDLSRNVSPQFKCQSHLPNISLKIPEMWSDARTLGHIHSYARFMQQLECSRGDVFNDDLMSTRRK